VATPAETQQGRVQGFADAGLEVFLGIPFARPPLGRLRWRAPEPPEPWAGVRDATRYGPSCVQPSLELEAFMPGFDVGPQSEDCLYLNVFTPAADAARRPVLVWIHGGAFTLGSASQRMYDVRRLAREGDLVLVTINYRLGALGYLHLAGVDPSLDTSACAGILDQAAALAWVRDNAAAFGGDPARVTIFGESAGGMSVGTLLALPAARGLFRGAIPQSGAAHSVNDADEGCRVARRFLAALGVAPGSLRQAWEAPADAVLKAQQAVEAEATRGTHVRPFRPVVDGRALPLRPIDAVREGSARGVALMVGACRDEEKLFTLWDAGARELEIAGVVERVERSLPGRGRELVEAYRAARGARGDDTSPFELHCAIQTDLHFRMPAVRLAEAQSLHQRDTWEYLVTWESTAMGGRLGACHGVDVPFVFGALGGERAGLFAGSGPEAERLSRQMFGAWVAFASGNDPNHPELSEWPRFEAARRATMLFGRDTRVVDAPLEAERRAWEGIL
jgi:para-nitrobenzyl esterase